MKIALESAKRLLRQLRGLFPRSLPVGATEFNVWADNIINTYHMPTKDRDSIIWALSNMIAHLGPLVAYKSDVYFGLLCSASAAKEVAFYEGRAAKARQAAALAKATEEAAAKAAELKQSEATESPVPSVVELQKQ